MTDLLRIGDVEAALARIRPYVHTTPVLGSRSLDDLAGAHLVLKAEHLQRTGSFKARGAFNALIQMGAEQRARGVLAVSSGNHAQAVALAARTLGTTAVVVCPADSNPVKLTAARAYGAEVISEGVTADTREEIVRRIARDRDLPLVHPYDDLAVMAGQGTAGLELTEQGERLDAVVVPVGGGGLLSGVATAIKDRWPRTRMVGVEPSAADDLARSMRAGHRIALDAAPDTVCDGVRAPCVGERPWEVIRRLVDDVVTVTDDQALAATRLLWERTKSVVEPSGALPLAAVLSGKVSGGRLGLVLSGGNTALR